MDIYEVRPRKDHRGVGLISDVLPAIRIAPEPSPIGSAIRDEARRARK
jgi:hypothetical protein